MSLVGALALIALFAADAPAPIVIGAHRVEDGALVDVQALELACMPAPEMLTEPRRSRAHFDDVAVKQNVALGDMSFVILERDPARSLSDPPPRLCRNIPFATPLRAPFFRAREPQQRWLVRRIQKSIVDDAAAVVAQASERALTASAHPRLLFAGDVAVAIALPVAGPR